MYTKAKIDKIIQTNGISALLPYKADILKNKKIEINLSDEDFIFLIDQDSKNEQKLLRFIKSVGDRFSIQNYLRYKEYKLTNPSDVKSEKVIELMYGEINEELIAKHRARRCPYDPQYIAERDNISIEDAIVWINKYKKDKATTKENFVKKHGEEEGLEKFKKFQKTSSFHKTKENYKAMYGEDWEFRWKLDMKLSSKYSKEFWMIKYNKTEDEARELVADTQRNNAGISAQYYLNKGLTLEQAEEILKEIWSRKGLNKDRFVARHGIEKWNELIFKKSCFMKKGKYVGRVASKKSMKVYLPLYKWLRKRGLGRYDIKIGTKNIVEFSIKDIENDKTYFYDFTDLKNKIIIEYNWEHVHPNIEKLVENGKIEEWRHVYNGKSAKEMKNIYDMKYKIARENGFVVLELWDSLSVAKNLKICKDFYDENNKNRA